MIPKHTKHTFLSGLLLTLCRLAHCNLDSQIQGVLYAKLNPPLDPRSFLDFRFDGEGLKMLPLSDCSNLFDYYLYDYKAWHSNSFNVELEDSKSFLEKSLASLRRGNYPFGLSDVQDFRYFLHRDRSGRQFAVGSFRLLKEGVGAKILFVCEAGNRRLVYMGIANRNSGLLSHTLPVYSSGEPGKPFEAFALEVP